MPVRKLLGDERVRAIFAWGAREEDLKRPYRACPKNPTSNDHEKIIRFSRQFIETGSFPSSDEKFKKIEGQDELYEIKGHQLRLIGGFFNGHFYIVKCDIKKKFKLDSSTLEAAKKNWEKCKKELRDGI